MPSAREAVAPSATEHATGLDGSTTHCETGRVVLSNARDCLSPLRHATYDDRRRKRAAHVVIKAPPREDQHFTRIGNPAAAGTEAGLCTFQIVAERLSLLSHRTSLEILPRALHYHGRPAVCNQNGARLLSSSSLAFFRLMALLLQGAVSGV